jgi:hypothetical protein
MVTGRSGPPQPSTAGGSLAYPDHPGARALPPEAGTSSGHRWVMSRTTVVSAVSGDLGSSCRPRRMRHGLSRHPVLSAGSQAVPSRPVYKSVYRWGANQAFQPRPRGSDLGRTTGHAARLCIIRGKPTRTAGSVSDRGPEAARQHDRLLRRSSAALSDLPGTRSAALAVAAVAGRRQTVCIRSRCGQPWWSISECPDLYRRSIIRPTPAHQSNWLSGTPTVRAYAMTSSRR